jgi:hypothetical protein
MMIDRNVPQIMSSAVAIAISIVMIFLVLKKMYPNTIPTIYLTKDSKN